MAPCSKDAEAESKGWIVDVGRVVFQHAQIYLTTPKPETGKWGEVVRGQIYGKEDDFRAFREISISQFSVAEKNRVPWASQYFYVVLCSVHLLGGLQSLW